MCLFLFASLFSPRNTSKGYVGGIGYTNAMSSCWIIPVWTLGTDSYGGYD